MKGVKKSKITAMCSGKTYQPMNFASKPNTKASLQNVSKYNSTSQYSFTLEKKTKPKESKKKKKVKNTQR